MIEATEAQIEQIARLAHEVNQAYNHCIGDTLLGRWEEIPEERREGIRVGIRETLRNPQMTSEQSHELWLKTMQERGWQYGPERNEDKKLHPAMVPYAELPLTTQYKDALFKFVVSSYGQLLVHGRAVRTMSIDVDLDEPSASK